MLPVPVSQADLSLVTYVRECLLCGFELLCCVLLLWWCVWQQIETRLEWRRRKGKARKGKTTKEAAWFGGCHNSQALSWWLLSTLASPLLLNGQTNWPLAHSVIQIAAAAQSVFCVAGSLSSFCSPPTLWLACWFAFCSFSFSLFFLTLPLSLSYHIACLASGTARAVDT